MMTTHPHRQERTHPRHARSPRRWLVAALVALVGSAWAQGVSQEAALDYRDPGLTATEASAEDALRVVTGPSGIGYSVNAKPRITITDRLNDDDGATWSSDLELTGTLSYRYNGVTLAREERDLERALRDVAVARRDGVLRALRAHVAWWTQSRSLVTATARLATARADLEAGQAGFDAGEIDRFRLDDLQLAFDRADLAYREAVYRDDDAIATAASFGLTGTPAYRAIRFELPEPEVPLLYAVRSREVVIAEAEAALLQAELFRPTKELRLSTSYATEDLRITGQVGVFNRTPGAELELRYPGASNPNWTIGLRAEIVLDESVIPRIVAARQRLDDARADLSDFLSTYPDDVAASRQTVAFAEENLANAERALALEEARVADLRSRLDAVRNAADAADRGREITSLERDLDRAITALDRAEGSLLSAWNTYVTRVNSYLALVQGTWQVR